MALKDGVLQAKPALLEPIMAVEVTVPEQYMGEVNRDLNGRRGRVLGLDSANGKQVISAHVPQAELFSYATELRSLTGGRGTFSSTLDHYEDVPVTPRRQDRRRAQEGPRRGPLTADGRSRALSRRGARVADRGHRRADVEAALVQRAADDRAGAADRLDREHVVDRGDAARRDDPAGLEDDERPQQLEIRALQEAVTSDGGHLERRDPGATSISIASAAGRPTAPGRQPSPSAIPSRTSIDATTRSGPWRATIARTNAGSVSAPVPTVTRAAPVPIAPATAIGRPQAPAELDARPPVHLGDDLGRRVQLPRLPVPGPVEVDDVEPGRPLADEPRGDRDRIGLVGDLAVEVALAQAHHPPAEDVDGRQQLEHRERPGSRIVDTRSPHC